MRAAVLLGCVAWAVRADTPIWSEPTGYSPQPRFEHSADRIGNQLYVFGGTLTNEVREADLHILNMDTMRWTSPAATGPKPLPTFGHATSVYADQLYIMFGSNGRSMTNRVWQFDTDNLKWSRVQSHGRVPTPRSYTSTVTADDMVYTFGGYDGVAYLNDLHRWQVFDPSTNSTGFWEKLAPKGDVPAVRAGAAAAYYGRKMYMFGGFEIGIYKKDFFKLDMDKLEWSRVHLTTDSACPMPPERAFGSLTLVGTKLVLYGGVYCHTKPYSFTGDCKSLSDVHQYDLMRSSFETSPSCGENSTGATKDAPPPRYGHSATLFGSRVVVFGGANWPNLFNDMAQYDVYDRSWTMVAGRPPYPRKQHSMNMATIQGKPHLVVFGGKHGVDPGHSASVHTFSLGDAHWEHPAKTASPGPDPTAHHAAAVADSTLLVFGGYNGTTSTNKVWATELDKSKTGGLLEWVLMETTGAVPSPRHGHAVVELDEPTKGSTYTWLQWGGVDCAADTGDCTFFNDMLSITADSLDGPLDYAVVPFNGNKPTPRASHTWTSIGLGKHVLYGGIGPSFSNKMDLWVFDESVLQFTQLTPSGAAAPTTGRFGHTAVAYRNKLWIYGGANCASVADCTFLDSIVQVDPLMGEFKDVAVAGSKPAGRLGHASVQLGEIMYTFGGGTKDRIFGDLFTMRPDASVANNTVVVGAGATLGQAGKNVRFFAQMQDSFYENRTTGEDKVEVAVVAADRRVQKKLVRSGATVPVAVQDMLSGSYRVDWFTNTSGWYNVSVAVNGDDTLPMFQTYVQAGEPDAPVSKVRGNALRGCIAGEECVFVVELFDDLGNRLDRTVPLDVQMIIDPSVVIPVKDYKRPVKLVNDSGTGLINVSYVAETAGNYSLEIKLRRELVSARAFEPVIEPAQGSNQMTTVHGDAMAGFRAGDKAQVVVTVRDAFQNLVGRGGDVVTASFKGKAPGLGENPAVTYGLEVPVEVVDNGDGTHNLTWTATIAGPYGLSISMNGDPLDACLDNYVPVAPAPVSAATTFAYGTGVRFATAGYRAYFTVQAADEFGNNVTEGGEKFNVLYSGQSDTAKDEATVIDHKDGTYTVSYLTTLSGDFMLSATLLRNGQFQSIHNSPFLGTAAAGGADPTRSFVYVETVDRPVVPNQMFRVVMGVHNYFKIQAVDRYGNNKTRGNDKFTAEIQGDVSMASFISDLGDGTYMGMYVCPAPGKYFLKIYYGDQQVQNTPITVYARENMDSCPNACSGHGECHNRECVCHSGYAGSDCSLAKLDCPGDCMGNGVCLNQKCYCYPGFSGTACDTTNSVCPNDCSGHGTCRDGNCVCEAGYEGLDCGDNTGLCPSKCNGNGECLTLNASIAAYACMCFPGYRGDACDEQYKFCPKGCSGKGKCMTSGICTCFPGWVGLDCATKATGGEKTQWTTDTEFFKRKPLNDTELAKLAAELEANVTAKLNYTSNATADYDTAPAGSIGVDVAGPGGVASGGGDEMLLLQEDAKRKALEAETARRIAAHKANLAAQAGNMMEKGVGNALQPMQPQPPAAVVPKGFQEVVAEAQAEMEQKAISDVVSQEASTMASAMEQDAVAAVGVDPQLGKLLQE